MKTLIRSGKNIIAKNLFIFVRPSKFFWKITKKYNSNSLAQLEVRGTFGISPTP